MWNVWGHGNLQRADGLRRTAKKWEREPGIISSSCLPFYFRQFKFGKRWGFPHDSRFAITNVNGKKTSRAAGDPIKANVEIDEEVAFVCHLTNDVEPYWKTRKTIPIASRQPLQPRITYIGRLRIFRFIGSIYGFCSMNPYDPIWNLPDYQRLSQF